MDVVVHHRDARQDRRHAVAVQRRYQRDRAAGAGDRALVPERLGQHSPGDHQGRQRRVEGAARRRPPALQLDGRAGRCQRAQVRVERRPHALDRLVGHESQRDGRGGLVGDDRPVLGRVAARDRVDVERRQRERPPVELGGRAGVERRDAAGCQLAGARGQRRPAGDLLRRRVADVGPQGRRDQAVAGAGAVDQRRQHVGGVQAGAAVLARVHVAGARHDAQAAGDDPADADREQWPAVGHEAAVEHQRRVVAAAARVEPAHRYPLLELSTASLVSGAFLVYESVWVAVAIAALLMLMPAIALIDIEHRIIPNRVMYPSLVAFPVYLVVARLAGAPVDLVRMVAGFALFGGALFVIALVSRGMGMGDVKLASLIGLVLGSLGLRYVGVAAGAAIALGGVGAHRRAADRPDPEGGDPVRPLPGCGRRHRRLLGRRRSPTGTSGRSSASDRVAATPNSAFDLRKSTLRDV